MAVAQGKLPCAQVLSGSQGNPGEPPSGYGRRPLAHTPASSSRRRRAVASKAPVSNASTSPAARWGRPGLRPVRINFASSALAGLLSRARCLRFRRSRQRFHPEFPFSLDVRRPRDSQSDPCQGLSAAAARNMTTDDTWVSPIPWCNTRAS